MTRRRTYTTPGQAYDDDIDPAEVGVRRIRLSQAQETLLRQTPDEWVGFVDSALQSLDVLADWGLIKMRTRLVRITPRGQRWLRTCG